MSSSQSATLDTEVLKEFSTQITTSIEGLVHRLAQDQKAKLEAEYQDRLEDEVAHIGYQLIEGETRPLLQGDKNGYIVLDDPCFAREAQQLFKESWMPVLVRKTNEKGEVTEQNIKEALITFLSGAPFDTGMIGSDLNSDILMRIMRAVEQKWLIDPNARSIIRAIKNYTIGNGFTFSCSVEEVDSIIRDFYFNNNMITRLRSAIPARYAFGEHYFFYKVSKNADVYVFDSTKPYDIPQIVVHEYDHLRPLAYGKTNTDKAGGLIWYKDINYETQRDIQGVGQRLGSDPSEADMVRDVACQMTRFNAINGVRGITDFYSTMRWLKFYEDFVLDRTVLNHERSKVVWIRKVKGSKSIPGGRAQRGPKGGQMLTETDQLEYRVVNAEIHADDVSDDGRLIRLMISAGHGVPEHVLFQDPSNQVYASIRSSDTPFSQNIRFGQQEWEEDLEVQARYVLRQKIKARKIPAKITVRKYFLESVDRLRHEFEPAIREFVETADGKIKAGVIKEMKKFVKELDQGDIRISTERVPMDFSFGDVVQQDPLKKAQETEVLLRNTLISGTEGGNRHGVKWLEQVNLLNMEQEALLGMNLIDSKLLQKNSTGKGTQKAPSDNPSPDGSITKNPDNPQGDGQ